MKDTRSLTLTVGGFGLTGLSSRNIEARSLQGKNLIIFAGGVLACVRLTPSLFLVTKTNYASLGGDE